MDLYKLPKVSSNRCVYSVRKLSNKAEKLSRLSDHFKYIHPDKKDKGLAYFQSFHDKTLKHKTTIVMQEASDALSKTANSDTVSTYQVSSVQLVTDKKLEAFNNA